LTTQEATPLLIKAEPREAAKALLKQNLPGAGNQAIGTPAWQIKNWIEEEHAAGRSPTAADIANQAERLNYGKSSANAQARINEQLAEAPGQHSYISPSTSGATPTTPVTAPRGQPGRPYPTATAVAPQTLPAPAGTGAPVVGGGPNIPVPSGKSRAQLLAEQ